MSERAKAKSYQHPADQIREELDRRHVTGRVRCIWEVGSRDGMDALELGRCFPAAQVHSFEPNPDTFQSVAAASSASHGRMSAHQIALTDGDRVVTFYKIDPSRTRTEWIDGNPGASSLFPVSGAYDAIEAYVQVPVDVQGRRPESVIAEGLAPSPQLVWMDAQGAELAVVSGFGARLAETLVVYTELSLRPIYEGQPLAADVVDYMTEQFVWARNLSTGPWQFDALFVNRAVATRRDRAAHKLLRASLDSGLGVGIAFPASPVKIGRSAWSRFMRRWRASSPG